MHNARCLDASIHWEYEYDGYASFFVPFLGGERRQLRPSWYALIVMSSNEHVAFITWYALRAPDTSRRRIHPHIPLQKQNQHATTIILILIWLHKPFDSQWIAVQRQRPIKQVPDVQHCFCSPHMWPAPALTICHDLNFTNRALANALFLRGPELHLHDPLIESDQSQSCTPHPQPGNVIEFMKYQCIHVARPCFHTDTFFPFIWFMHLSYFPTR